MPSFFERYVGLTIQRVAIDVEVDTEFVPLNQICGLRKSRNLRARSSAVRPD